MAEGLSQRALRRKFPKEQLLLEGTLDESALSAIQEAQDDDSFQLVSSSIDTQYACPCGCGFEWSGNPRPATSSSKEDKK